MNCISIAGYSFHGALADGTIDLYGYLEACRYRYQLDTADIWCGLLGQDPDAYLLPANLLKVKAALTERGLTLVNYHADGCHIWEDDPAVRERFRVLAERHIAAAELLGANTVRIDAGGRARHWTGEQLELIAKRYREWATRAHDRGYAIGPETHWGPENHIDSMLALAQAVDAPGYGILLHLGKDVDGAPDEYDRALAPLAVHTHVDQRTTYTRIESALRILRDSGYHGCLGVEHHSARNEYAEVGAQLALVRRAVTLLAAEAGSPGTTGNPLLGGDDVRHQR
jgi:sugar phosphate isomerase/epimerase